MAARIYSLAKELNIDSKLLVDICAKAGLPGKGSALASLTDEEVAKLKAYLSGGSRAAAAPTRPAAVASGPIHEIPTHSSSGAATAVAPPPPPPTPAPPVAPAPPKIAATAAQPPVPVRPAPARPIISNEPPPVSRESYIPPTGTGRPPLMVPRRDKSAGDKKAGGEGGKSSEREKPSAPAVRVGRMPTATPPPVAKSNEPEPQKPDIKLPLDAIRARQKGGTKPLEELVKKHEEKRKTAVARGKDGREEPGAARPPAAGGASRPPLTLGGRDRNKRGKCRRRRSRRARSAHDWPQARRLAPTPAG